MDIQPVAMFYPREYWNRELDMPSGGTVTLVPAWQLELLPNGQVRWYRFFSRPIGPQKSPQQGLLMDEDWGLTAEEDGEGTYNVRWPPAPRKNPDTFLAGVLGFFGKKS